MVRRSLLLALAMGVAAARVQRRRCGRSGRGGVVDGAPHRRWPAGYLAGVWTNPTITPFERGTFFSYSGVAVPESAAGRAFFTAEEEARFAALTAADREASLGYVNRSLDAGTRLLSTLQTSLVVDPADGRVPVQEWAESSRDSNRASEREDYRHMSVWDRCLTRGVPGSMFPAGYNNAYRFVQTLGRRRDPLRDDP